MPLEWTKDLDGALARAKSEHKPLLIDFSAAPAGGGCVRLEAESYHDPELSNFIAQNFIAVTANIKEAGALFHRFDVLWTPTAMILDESGVERFRSEGYLPKKEFGAQLLLGLARNAFEHKRWPEAERWYDAVLEQYADSVSAAEALYWKAVCRYKTTNDHTWLAKINAGFKDHHQDSIWAEKASIFLEAH